MLQHLNCHDIALMLFGYIKQGCVCLFYREHYLYPYSNGRKICQKTKLLCNQLGWHTQLNWHDRKNVLTNTHSWCRPIKENTLALSHAYHKPSGERTMQKIPDNVQSTLKCHHQTIVSKNSKYENYLSDFITVLVAIMILLWVILPNKVVYYMNPKLMWLLRLILKGSIKIAISYPYRYILKSEI